ncbi:MAG: CGNR zinc finger domain-containing protein [Bacillota bacterium]|nr:CGNR zinc finger domain-containing protein [Bacillota bacterium]
MGNPIGPDQPKGVLLKTTWARRRYYVDEGYIKPIPGLKTEWYNPFASYYGLDSPYKGRSFYLELVELNENDPRAVEEFASKWGLLGLVFENLIQAHYVRTPEGYALPKHRLDCVIPGFDEVWQGKGSAVVVPLSTPYVPEDVIWDAMVTRGWVKRETDGGLRVLVDGTFSELEQRLTREHEQAEFAGFQLHIQDGGEALVRDRLGTPCVKSLIEYLQDYFPEPLPKPQSFGPGLKLQWLRDGDPVFPALDSDFIWDHLCEPLDDFALEVRRFRDVYTACAKRPDLSRDQVRWISAVFDQHLESVHPTLTLSDDHETQPDGFTYSGEWSYPSLLAVAYMMLYLDFTGNRRLHFCANDRCRKPFVTDRTDRIYCSARCLNATKHRKYRSGNPEVNSRKGGMTNGTQTR